MTSVETLDISSHLAAYTSWAIGIKWSTNKPFSGGCNVFSCTFCLSFFFSLAWRLRSLKLVTGGFLSDLLSFLGSSLQVDMCIYTSELHNMNLHNSLKETTNSLNMSWQHHCSWEEGYLHWKIFTDKFMYSIQKLNFFCIYLFSVLICSNIQILYVKKKKTHRHYDLMFCVLAFQQNKRFSNPKYTTEDIHRT